MLGGFPVVPRPARLAPGVGALVMVFAEHLKIFIVLEPEALIRPVMNLQDDAVVTSAEAAFTLPARLLELPLPRLLPLLAVQVVQVLLAEPRHPPSPVAA